MIYLISCLMGNSTPFIQFVITCENFIIYLTSSSSSSLNNLQNNTFQYEASMRCWKRRDKVINQGLMAMGNWRCSVGACERKRKRKKKYEPPKHTNMRLD
uniref:Uncharacterized protein n=1 Tax=Caenorhabditis japonica TaxID=281687 RepID=A0A8R1IPD8_CAEJA